MVSFIALGLFILTWSCGNLSMFVANQYRIRVESSPSPAPISTYGGLEAVLIGGSEEGGGVVDFVNNTFLVTQ